MYPRIYRRDCDLVPSSVKSGGCFLTPWGMTHPGRSPRAADPGAVRSLKGGSDRDPREGNHSGLRPHHFLVMTG
jgi:hypothetical protein